MAQSQPQSRGQLDRVKQVGGIADMLVGADQINAALRRSVTLMGQPGVIDNMNAAIAAFASRTAHRQQRRAVQAAEMPRGIHVGLAIDEIQQSEAVADALQQPGGLARQRHRRVQSGIARPRSFPMSGRLQQAATRQRRGRDNRPELTMGRMASCSADNSSTASLSSLARSERGVMKSALRLELRIFSSAARPRSSP